MVTPTRFGRWVQMVAVAALAIGCTSTLQRTGDTSTGTTGGVTVHTMPHPVTTPRPTIVARPTTDSPTTVRPCPVGGVDDLRPGDGAQHPCESVRQIQAFLIGCDAIPTGDTHAGVIVAVDGWYGPQTESAVRWFQRQWGLPEETVISPELWRLFADCALMTGCPLAGIDDLSASSAAGLECMAVVAAQLQLYLQTCAPWVAVTLELNGRYEDHTVERVQSFQQEIGLPADGELDPDTWRELWKCHNVPMTYWYSPTSNDYDELT